MSKAILVMDMPENCQKCDLYVCYRQYAGDPGDSFCGKTKKDVNPNEKPDWCPLRDIPEKRLPGHSLAVAIENDCFDETAEDKAWLEGNDKGYNACIDEILRGCEENG